MEASEPQPPPVRKPVSGVAAQFAAQVAAVADTTNKDKVIYLTLSFMASFQTHISKCSERGGKTKFLDFFFIEASATKRFARSRIFRYGCLMIILSNRQ